MIRSFCLGPISLLLNEHRSWLVTCAPYRPLAAAGRFRGDRPCVPCGACELTRVVGTLSSTSHAWLPRWSFARIKAGAELARAGRVLTLVQRPFGALR